MAIKESYLIRVKFGFHEETYEAIGRLAAAEGVREAEIVRRALQLYVSCYKELKLKDNVIVTKDHLQ